MSKARRWENCTLGARIQVQRELKDCTKYRAKVVAQRCRASTSSHRHAGRTRTKRIFSEQRLKMYIHNDS